MKEIKSTKKVSIFNKLLIKMCRIFGYELIDQSSLQFPVSNKSYEDQINIPGEKSFTLGLGQIKITRKVKSLDILIKSCTKVQLVSQNKKRIFENEKSEYTYRSIKSLIKSAIELKKNYNEIEIKFTIIDVNSSKNDLEKIKSLMEGGNFRFTIINIDVEKAKNDSLTLDKNNKEIENNMATTMASIRKSFSIAKESNDLIYFVEDDYIHNLEALTEMILSYERFSSILEKEIFLLSTDYPYLYKKIEKSNIYIGNKYHWRTVNESLLTFMTSQKMIEKYYDGLIEMATTESKPFEKNLHKIYEEELCLSPIPSLSIHCTNVNSVFGLSPNINIKKLWNDAELE